MTQADASSNAGFSVVYLALGRPYVAMAMTSAMSLRISNPDVPYTILTDTVLDDAGPWFGIQDAWTLLPSEPSQDGQPPLRRKTSVYPFFRHDRTLFIDADTVVLGDLRTVDHALEHFDVLARPYLERGAGRHSDHPLTPSGPSLGEAPSCNTGVIGFRRSEAVEDFFVTWAETIERMGIANDQPPFVPAIYASPEIRFFPLPRRFNEGAPSAMETDDITILHYKRRGDRTTRRLVEDVAVRLFGDDPELRAEVQRALEPGKKKLRERAYRRSRNQDRFKPSIVAPIRREAEQRGWL